ncbi:hypothetical protein AA101099_0195 [Neoasaia chiangmaiensis NBRC 101099]|uniref:Uncharacterized protein n=2 Tax=Neoasaia chiangmaiensis TaxID=320497 RepID=A0A1U9KPX6_9PROT|nr:hypothetical protein [Neoasaia chiangmaiensis]AQS87825.1 hypothetical protein A0U93_07620 [Neoasaia chiangmaiensis]GBR35960.1 hypothetical protein AA101099_0195 [Neoasaia chiangmaiensis NBRC 101099]GEN14441.1 hypothetical protein NCH01_08720 [Neoasaia chiangmaiensis]
MALLAYLLTPFWAVLLPTHMADAQDIAMATPDPARTETAQSLTQNHGWAAFARSLARADAALTPNRVLPILRHAPPQNVPMLRAALRSGLTHDAGRTLRLLDPARDGAFSGRAVCASGNAGWRRSMVDRLSSDHDIADAFQHQDCLDAIRYNPGG